jgi:hypothetical protein
MFRVTLALVLSYLVSSVWPQFQPAPAAAGVSGPTHAKSNGNQPTPGTGTQTRPAGRADGGHCDIGVIPIAGNLFWIEKLGPTTFNNTHVRAAADGWGLDDLVVSRVRAAARGAAVQRIAFSREELARARGSASIFRSADSRMKDFARQVAAGTNCDRYVVVHRSTAGKPVFGIGVVKFVSLTDSRTFLFVLMHIVVYDGRTFELIKEGPARNSDESLLARAYLNPVGGPYRALDERSFPASREEVAANPILREGVRALLTESLDKTLPGLLGKTSR